MWLSKLSRRTFLKAAAGTTAALSASNIFSFGDWMKKASAAETVKTPSLCGSCSSWCGLWIHTKNGRIWKATGQKDHPASKGKLCARGHATIMWAYSKDRITQPMKRVGEDKYEPVSWDQAYNEISVKLAEVLAKYGPEPIFYLHNPKPTSNFYFHRLMGAIGTSTLLTHHSICNISRTAGNKAITGPMASADINNAQYIMFLGRSYAEGLSPSTAAQLAAAQERGAKVVIVDPRQSASCILANEWVPIRPGTDLGMLLAIAHVLIKEELYDKEFVAQYTTGFDEFKKAMAQYTPEWAQTVTDIPAATIYRIAREMAEHRPASLIEQGYKAPSGANYVNGTDTFRMMAAVNGLLGNFGKKGGMNFSSGPKFGSLSKDKYPVPPKATVPRCDGAGIKGEYPLSPTHEGSIPVIAQKAIAGKIKAGFLYSINPVRNAPDIEYMRKAFKSLELLVVCDIQWSETASLAHYILPECSYVEREDLPTTVSGGKVTMRCQAIDVIHPLTKPLNEIVTEMAQVMGYGKYFNFTQEEQATAMLKPLKLTLEDLRTKGTVAAVVPKKEPKPLTFGTKSKKLEFSSADFAANGFSAVPVWKAPLSTAGKDSFVLISGKQAVMSHTCSASIPFLMQIAKDYNLERIWLNADRAKQMGIKDGDMVEVKSSLAAKRVRVKVTERIHPHAAFLPLGYGGASPRLKTAYGFGISSNDLVPFAIEPISGAALMMETLVKIRKVGE